MRIVELSGGVGGARLARGLASLPDVDLTVVVNVGDDDENHGLHVSPDLDTVVYTLAGLEGPEGWGRAGDTFEFNDELGRFGMDNTFRLGDRDMALKTFRTLQMRQGMALSEVTDLVTGAFDLATLVLPVTDDILRTRVRIPAGWVSFQEYFVGRRHQDEVMEVEFEGASVARPAPGVLESIADADLVVIGPSNPPLSIQPILEVDGVRAAVAAHPRVTAVSPLIGGKTIKGPADRVMASLGFPPGNAGVAAVYDGLIDRLVIDRSDIDDMALIDGPRVEATDILIQDPAASARLAKELTRS